MNVITISRMYCALPFLFISMISSGLFADLVLDFEDMSVAAAFDGDQSGDFAGPFNIDGEDVTFTTDAVSGSVSTSSFGLGLDTGGTDPDNESFNIGENWSINTDTALFFQAIEIGGLQSEETFSIQSNAWVNLAGITPGGGVTYTAATGTFELTDGPTDDLFTLAELTGGTSLSFNPGTVMTLGNLTSTFGLNDDVELESMTFQFNPVPEPASGLFLLFGLLGFSLRRTRA